MNGSGAEAIPRLVFWELTARCNLRCQHCRAEAQDEAAAGELTTNQIRQVACDIRACADPICVLTGGEPLSRSDFFDIARDTSTVFSRVALATNGTLIDHALAAEIAGAGIRRVSISIDGPDAATHDAFRGQPGSFDAAMRGLDALRRIDLPVQINVTVARHNVDALPQMLDLALRIGVAALHVFVLVPVGCGVEIHKNMRPPPARMEELLTWLYEQSIKLSDKLHIKATCAPQYYRIMRQRKSEVSNSNSKFQIPNSHWHAVTRGCLAGTAVCFISRIGDVQPCGYLPLRVGNVLEQPFSAIWNSADLFRTLRDTESLQGKCGACGFRKLCSGCRARAYAEYGNALAQDPDCAYEPETRHER